MLNIDPSAVVNNLDIRTVTAEQLERLNEQQFNLLRNRAVEMQDPDLATMLVWSAFIRYYRRMDHNMHAEIHLQASLKLTNLSIEKDKMLSFYFEILKDGFGLSLCETNCIKIPSLTEIEKLGGRLRESSTSEQPLLVKRRYTERLSEPAEMLEMLQPVDCSTASTPIILPNFHNISPKTTDFSNSLQAFVHDLIHFLRKNSVQLQDANFKIQRNWAKLILAAAQQLSLEEYFNSSHGNNFGLEKLLDLEADRVLDVYFGIWSPFATIIPTEAQVTSKDDAKRRLAFRILSNLSIHTKNDAPEDIQAAYGLDLDSMVPLQSSPYADPIYVKFRALLTREDNPFRSELTHLKN